MSSSLPQNILDLALFDPVEDFMLDLLRPELTGIQVQSRIRMDQTFPMILVRRVPGFEGNGDPRFITSAGIAIHAMCDGANADEDAAILSEAVRRVLFDAMRSSKVVPGRGHMTDFFVNTAARRVTDWSTAVGPVQYADLPSGVERYEAQYHVTIRRPVAAP